MSTFSDKIIAARKAKKWTQTDMAKALKVNVKNVARWENENIKPSFDAAVALAGTLGLSLDYLGGLTAKSDKKPLQLLFEAKLDNMSKQKQSALKTILEAF